MISTAIESTQPPPRIPAFPALLRSPIISRRAARVLGALLFGSACCLGMIVVRWCCSGTWDHLFIVWNLVLAWVPLPFSVAAYRMHTSRTRRNVLFGICALTWFVFFPNAPYITTDFVHLKAESETLAWIDLISTASFAWIGLCLGFCSLYLMQEVVRYRFGRSVGWGFVLIMLASATVGTYLGRFLRWNSWDVLHPLSLLSDFSERTPLLPATARVYLGLMFLFLLLSYGVLHALTHLHKSDEQ